VTVNAIDDEGDPVLDVPVTFTVVLPVPLELLELPLELLAVPPQPAAITTETKALRRVAR
jgi:hypothetical protein